MAILNDTPRIPPQNIEAEQAVLGAILSDNKNLEKVSDFLLPQHFSYAIHGKIYEACCKYIEHKGTVDIVILKPLFANDEALKDVGGAEYLAKLVASASTIVNVVDYGREILDRYIRRQLISLGTDVVNDAFDIQLGDAAVSQIERAEKSLYEIANEGELSGGPMALSVALGSTLKSAELAMKNPNGIGGVPTGLVDMDKLLGGLYNSDLIILAGRPAMGKSALATTIAFNVAQAFERENKKSGATKKSVALFSLEMSAEQVAGRILASKASISNSDMRTGKLSEDQFTELMAGVNLLSKVPLYVDETPAITVQAIKNRARRMKRNKEQGLGLIVIDYLQLITASGRSENRVQELSEMTRALKIMAKELDVPVIVLSQLSRLVEQRDNKRPMLSDLRESGSIEQDADIVMFVYREIYYLQNEQPTRHLNETPEKFALRCAELEQKKLELENQAEVIVAKQRHGKCGTIKLFFDGEFSRFTDLEQG